MLLLKNSDLPARSTPVCVCVCVCGVYDCHKHATRPRRRTKRRRRHHQTRNGTRPCSRHDVLQGDLPLAYHVRPRRQTLEQDKKNTTTKLNNTKQLQCKTNQADVHARTPVASASWIETRLPFVKWTHGSWANRRDTALPLFDIFVFRCRLAPPGLTLSGDAASFVFRRALGRATLKRQGRCSSRNFSGPPSLPQR